MTSTSVTSAQNSESVTNVEVTLQSISGNMGQLTGAGKILDTLLCDIEAPVGTRQFSETRNSLRSYGSPHHSDYKRLKVQSNKTVHITQFFTEQCKR